MAGPNSPAPRFHTTRWAHPHHALPTRWLGWTLMAVAIGGVVALMVDAGLRIMSGMAETPLCSAGLRADCRAVVGGGPDAVQPLCRTPAALADALEAVRSGAFVPGQHPQCRTLAGGTEVLALGLTLNDSRHGVVVQVYPQTVGSDPQALWMDPRSLSPSLLR